MKHLFPFLILYIIGGSFNAKTISGVIIDSKSKENVGLCELVSTPAVLPYQMNSAILRLIYQVSENTVIPQ